MGRGAGALPPLPPAPGMRLTSGRLGAGRKLPGIPPPPTGAGSNRVAGGGTLPPPPPPPGRGSKGTVGLSGLAPPSFAPPVARPGARSDSMGVKPSKDADVELIQPAPPWQFYLLAVLLLSPG